MFVYDDDINLIAVSEIVATKSFNVATESGPRQRVRAHLRDGNSTVLSGGSEILLENAAAAVVPAQPGFFKLWFYEHEGKPESTRVPIIAWRITADQAIPVAPGDGIDDADDPAVLLPDGRVVSQFGTIHKTVAAWETYRQEEEIEAMARKAERAAREKAAAS